MVQSHTREWMTAEEEHDITEVSVHSDVCRIVQFVNYYPRALHNNKKKKLQLKFSILNISGQAYSMTY